MDNDWQMSVFPDLDPIKLKNQVPDILYKSLISLWLCGSLRLLAGDRHIYAPPHYSSWGPALTLRPGKLSGLRSTESSCMAS